VPWIVDFSEKTDHRTAAIGEFVQILLAQDDGASSAKTTDDLGVFGGNAIFLRSTEQAAGGGGADSSDIDNVLEPDGNAVQRSEIGSVVDFPLGVTSSVESGFGRDGDEGVERRVELFDAREAIVGEFDRRDGAVENLWTQFADSKRHDPRSTATTPNTPFARRASRTISPQNRRLGRRREPTVPIVWRLDHCNAGRRRSWRAASQSRRPVQDYRQECGRRAANRAVCGAVPRRRGRLAPWWRRAARRRC